MNVIELLDIINTWETSKVQFKETISSADGLAAEFVAMSNSLGGLILVGVKDKTGDLIGLTYQQLQETGQLVANIATNNIIPLIYIETEVISIEKQGKKINILVIHIKEGINKPYKDRGLRVWIKQGSDKRKVTDNNELLRLYQSSGNLFADEMLIENTSNNDIDLDKIEKYLVAQKMKVNKIDERLLINLRVLKNERLTLGGLLFFGKNPQQYKPVFLAKAVSFFGNSIGSKEYRVSLDIQGIIPEMFDASIHFFNDNLKHIQKDQNVNSTGVLEISEIAIEELLQNAFVHRDYLKNSPIRLFIFDNRIEIISPGKLPNSLTIENIKLGNAVARNNLLVSYCSKSKMMNYRGWGSGIIRALEEQPNIELINDVDGEQFIVKIPRLKFIEKSKFLEEFSEILNHITDLFEYPEQENLQFKINAEDFIRESLFSEDIKEKLLDFLQQ